MTRININRNRAETLFYNFRDLGLMLSRMNGIVQNPDFADTEDIKLFKENCKNFENEYLRVKNEVIELFEK